MAGAEMEALLLRHFAKNRDKNDRHEQGPGVPVVRQTSAREHLIRLLTELVLCNKNLHSPVPSGAPTLCTRHPQAGPVWGSRSPETPSL